MSRIRLTICFVLLFSFMVQDNCTVWAGEFSMTPTVSTGVEYSDNVEEKKNGKDDFIMSVTPGGEVKYEASRLEFSAKGGLEIREYAKGVKKSENLGNLDASMKLEALENFMFLEVSDAYTQVYSDSTRGDLEEGENDSSGVTDQNRFVVSPYIETDLLKRTRVKSGYRYERYDYSSDKSTDKLIHTVFGDVDHELTDRWSLDTRLSYARHEPDNDASALDVYKLLVGTTYEYAEDSEVYFRVGPAYRVKENGGSSSDPSWEAGVVHALDKGMSLALTTKRDLEEDPESASPRDSIVHSVRFSQALERADWYARVSYGTYESDNSVSDTIRWSPGIGGSYLLTERLKLTGGVSSSFSDADSYTARYFGNAGLRYQFSDTFAGRFQYRYKLVDTTGAGEDYQVNRFGVYLDASF